jgi:ABC-type transporter MlaC component
VTVTAKGVNDLALKRSEYTSFLKDKSLDELISFLKEQAMKCGEAQK